MLETTINMPEWHTDIALGFANVNEGTNVKKLPENIGSIKIRIVSMEGYNIETIKFDYLRLERCENNSFSDNEWLPEILKGAIRNGYCIVEEDKQKMNLRGEFESI